MQRSLERTRGASASRADLPPEVLAMARRFGISDDNGTRIVHLTQVTKCGSNPVRSRSRSRRSKPSPSQKSPSPGVRNCLGQRLSMNVIEYCLGMRLDLRAGRSGSTQLYLCPRRNHVPRRSDVLSRRIDVESYALLLNWRVLNALAVAPGESARRSEIRLILDAARDPIRIGATSRSRQNGRAVTNSPWFGRANDYRKVADI